MYEKNLEMIEDNVKLSYNNINQYSNIIFSNKYQNIIFPYVKIRLSKNSFMKICHLAELYPEEVTRFTFYKEQNNKNNIFFDKNEESNITLNSDLSTLIETSPLGKIKEKNNDISNIKIDILMFKTSKTRIILEKIYRYIYPIYLLCAIIRMISLYSVYIGYNEEEMSAYKILSIFLIFLLVNISVYGLCQIRNWYVIHLKIVSVLMIFTIIICFITCYIPRNHEFDQRIIDEYTFRHYFFFYLLIILLIFGIIINYKIYKEFKNFINETSTLSTQLIFDS